MLLHRFRGFYHLLYVVFYCNKHGVTTMPSDTSDDMDALQSSRLDGTKFTKLSQELIRSAQLRAAVHNVQGHFALLHSIAQ